MRIYPPKYTPPGIAMPIDLVVNMVPWMLFILLFCFVLFSMFAALIPARRAAKQNIVDSLGHV
jgi:putative ABC transport system permease protein